MKIVKNIIFTFSMHNKNLLYIIKESTIENLEKTIINIIKETQYKLNQELSTLFKEYGTLIPYIINQKLSKRSKEDGTLIPYIINQKYLKYKQKYLQLKKNLNN